VGQFYFAISGSILFFISHKKFDRKNVKPCKTRQKQ